MEIPDILIETLCTTALFIVLELTVIIPLIRKAFAEQVDNRLVPTMKTYISGTIEDFKTSLVPTITTAVSDAGAQLWNRIRGRRGGSQKGTNAFIDRVLNGEDPDEIAKNYSEEVVSSGLSILEAVADRLKNRSSSKENDDNDDSGGFLSEVN